MALTLKKPIATLHKQEQHISVRKRLTTKSHKRSIKRTSTARRSRASKQLSLFSKR